MSALELKVHPPVVALLVALAMWAIAQVAPPLALPASLRLGAALAFAVAGGALAAAGAIAFRRARTTINPHTPDKSSSLVTTGVYRVTRNPMYTGLALTLAGWATWLGFGWPLLGLPLFIAYISRFQIAPEERALARTFGTAYATYRARVRRWV